LTATRRNFVFRCTRTPCVAFNLVLQFQQHVQPRIVIVQRGLVTRPPARRPAYLSRQRATASRYVGAIHRRLAIPETFIEGTFQCHNENNIFCERNQIALILATYSWWVVLQNSRIL